ncbi:ATP-grasp domain-containing protein [Derxia gummosa]|uniref:ATP-grasp domain-containing protein n=1 Tax=Derxia gummosa DSM 723 TaxID=1121388 RepID=A0A8B6XDB7_9BURK|nr:RimK family alpha-L-glutamate ligase [Derxia gummosa]
MSSTIPSPAVTPQDAATSAPGAGHAARATDAPAAARADAPTDAPADAPVALGSAPGLLGLATLMRLAFDRADLVPISKALIARASRDESDADALMDLATLLQLQGIADLGLATLMQALAVCRVYELPAARQPALRLLALMAPGELMANAPLPFLFEGGDISLTMLYLLPGEPVPAELPPHDAIFIAISESDANRPLLDKLARASAAWTAPVINRPGRVALTARDRACELLADVEGVRMPATARAPRAALQAIAAGRADLARLLPDGPWPLIVRPVDSHAGHDLERIADAAALDRYLAAHEQREFFIARFIDYRGRDGLFRKYRVVLIDGIPHAGHMAISADWMIHYLNAGMTDSEAKRAEEAAFMRDFDADFAQRHRVALHAIGQRFGLDWLVIDCAETATGDLLVFEVDPGAVVHSMDPPDLFPYKREPMQRVFSAFRALLARRIDQAARRQEPRHVHRAA